MDDMGRIHAGAFQKNACFCHFTAAFVQFLSNCKKFRTLFSGIHRKSTFFENLPMKIIFVSV
jgi:hypothetical protein